MINRVSSVGRIDNLLTDVTSSIVVGDSEKFTPVVHAISVLREKAIFFENEFLFSDYPIFTRTLLEPIVTENVKMTRINESPVIRVERINMFRLVASSLVQVGSNRLIRAERRVKHVRHLLRTPPQ